jgi:hypothetical protein
METNQDKSVFNFVADDNTSLQLKGISRWAKINAIVAFASLGLSIISSVLVMVKYSYYFGTQGLFGGKQTIVGWIISLVMNITLLNAANNIQKAIGLTDQNLFNKGLSNLASYFKIAGIVILIALILFIFAFAFLALFWGENRYGRY